MLIRGDNPGETERFYKAFLQWRARHEKSELVDISDVRIRKLGPEVYLWLE